MSEVIKLPTLSDVEEEAAAWVWRLDSESLTETEKQGLRDLDPTRPAKPAGVCRVRGRLATAR